MQTDDTLPSLSGLAEKEVDEHLGKESYTNKHPYGHRHIPAPLTIAVLMLLLASESSRRLFRTHIAEPSPRASYSAGLG